MTVRLGHIVAGGGLVTSAFCLYGVAVGGDMPTPWVWESLVVTIVLGYGVFSLPLVIARGLLHAKDSDLVWPYYAVAAVAGGACYVAFLSTFGWGAVTFVDIVGATVVFVIGCFPGPIVLGVAHLLRGFQLWVCGAVLPAASVAIVLATTLM